MDIGLTIPTRGPLATRQGIETMARRAEALEHEEATVIVDAVHVDHPFDGRQRRAHRP